MSVNYSVAGEWAQDARAQAIIESGEDPLAIGGDGGQAFGILQMHPATFIRYYTQRIAPAEFAPAVDDTLTDAQLKAYATFRWMCQLQNRPVSLTIMAWRLGVAGVFVDGKRDQRYWQAWQAALAKVKSES